MYIPESSLSAVMPFDMNSNNKIVQLNNPRCISIMMIDTFISEILLKPTSKIEKYLKSEKW